MKKSGSRERESKRFNGQVCYCCTPERDSHTGDCVVVLAKGAVVERVPDLIRVLAELKATSGRQM